MFFAVESEVCKMTLEATQETEKYSNNKGFALSFEEDTAHDRAFDRWFSMNPMERLEVMNKVSSAGTITDRFHACINYLADHMDEAAEPIMRVVDSGCGKE